MATLSELRTRVKQRTDNEYTGSDFVDDAELTQLINKSYMRLHGLLLKAGLDSLPELSVTITGDGSRNYDLPDDFLAVISVFYVNNGHYNRLSRHNARRYPDDLTVSTGATTYRTFGLRTNAKIQFDPIPSTGDFLIVYHPAPTELSGDSDTLDGVLGWEELVVVDVSIDVLIKEGAPPDVIAQLKEQKAELKAEIAQEASARDMSEHRSVQDTRWSGGLRDEAGFLPGDWRQRGYRGSF